MGNILNKGISPIMTNSVMAESPIKADIRIDGISPKKSNIHFKCPIMAKTLMNANSPIKGNSPVKAPSRVAEPQNIAWEFLKEYPLF